MTRFKSGFSKVRTITDPPHRPERRRMEHQQRSNTVQENAMLKDFSPYYGIHEIHTRRLKENKKGAEEEFPNSYFMI